MPGRCSAGESGFYHEGLPVDRPSGRGRLDDVATTFSPHLWAMTHKGLVAIAAALTTGLVFTAIAAAMNPEEGPIQALGRES